MFILYVSKAVARTLSVGSLRPPVSHRCAAANVRMHTIGTTLKTQMRGVYLFSALGPTIKESCHGATLEICAVLTFHGPNIRGQSASENT